MAAKVARAVPQVIDCDRVALFLDDGDWTGADAGELRFAAAHGYPDAAVALLSIRPITEAQLRTMREDGIEYTLLSDVGTAAAVAVPICLAGNTIGCIVAGVTAIPNASPLRPACLIDSRGWLPRHPSPSAMRASSSRSVSNPFMTL